MKKILLALAVVSLVGCGQVDAVKNDFKSMTGQLARTVTLYAADGRVIKAWQTTNQIRYAGPVAAFIDNDGINVRVSGTFVIEGKR